MLLPDHQYLKADSLESCAAIAAAVSDALGGIYMHRMPMTPWRILKAMRQNGLDPEGAPPMGAGD